MVIGRDDVEFYATEYEVCLYIKISPVPTTCHMFIYVPAISSTQG
jgi:hypothetical protein